ncbi:MepB family protein [Priestia megaterium]|uniref:MepB family protein n=1 Tax=Priestia megaterium TaxID=1404 RepID=UPI0035CF824C
MKKLPIYWLLIPSLVQIDLDNSFFPKEVLLKQKILKTATTKGKMAIRVYPIWDKPTSKQAIETQKWQLEYFVETNDANNLPRQKLLKLYT